MSDTKLRAYDKPELRNFCVKAVTTQLIKLVRKKPKTFLNWHMNTKIGWVCNAIWEILNDPANIMHKTIIDNSVYAHKGGHIGLPYRQLALKIYPHV